ncbi:SDR family oxidoreductase [Salinisphaera sp.]|uniref:SDR family oxidoreductase n=1 Tax=Salinisphaera sp. TaxID=1914330 RepID=UPI002D789DC7|nr:SDR family oxidoreductase [Salinisphaera sp.]HET7315494.1 SDR family oxidoreductase [Salinisphaera sp.]
MDMFRLDGQNALVTGAGSGIGQAIAVGLAEAGADIGCFSRKTSQGLDETIERIERLGRRAIRLTGSVTEEQDLTDAVAAIEKGSGPLTIAVNSAGIANAFPAEDMPIEEWQRVIDTNYTGLFKSCRAAARAMFDHGGGSIINISSMSGWIANRGLSQAHYNSSKAAVSHLTRSLATEWCDRGVRVNAISPGYTLSPMNKRPEVAAQRQQFADETPMQRLAEVGEMVGPAVFFASRASSFCTGADLVVDGGFVCW